VLVVDDEEPLVRLRGAFDRDDSLRARASRHEGLQGRWDVQVSGAIDEPRREAFPGGPAGGLVQGRLRDGPLRRREQRSTLCGHVCGELPVVLAGLDVEVAGA